MLVKFSRNTNYL